MTSEDIQKSILYADEEMIIANKPSGIATQDSKNKENLSFHRILEDHLLIRLFVVHRIDQPVSGVVIFAKNPRSTAALNNLIRGNQIQKIYLAAVKNRPSENAATLQHELIHNTRNHKSIISNKKTKHSKTAILNFKIIGNTDNYTFLNISIKTGRFHQIRAQLAAIGSPVKGDVKYGARRKNPDRSIHLHAYQITFPHPIHGEQIKISAPLPNDSLWNALRDINPLILQDKTEK